jgi:hypothetical protein
VGPSSVEKAHCEYNSAIVKTTDEQLLLNMVRLKYRDNPYFLEVSSISENRKLTTRIGPSGSKLGFDKNAGHYELGIIAYSEIFQNPTIFYTPLQGEKFTQRMVSPIPLAVVFGLMQSGWSPQRVFNLCIESINDLDNASSASGPTPTTKPVYEPFSEAVNLIENLYKQKCLLIGTRFDHPKEWVVQFTDSNHPGVQELKSILGLDPNQSEFHLSSNALDKRDTILTIRTRSMIEVLFYLSHAVDVPFHDIETGLVTETKDENGAVFHWNQHLSGKWIAIHCAEAKARPENAFVSIFYRGKWFYIADNDLNSKSTFLFISYLFNLQAGDSMAVVPTLSLSAN